MPSTGLTQGLAKYVLWRALSGTTFFIKVIGDRDFLPLPKWQIFVGSFESHFIDNRQRQTYR
jgi:hypothetical protein